MIGRMGKKMLFAVIIIAVLRPFCVYASQKDSADNIAPKVDIISDNGAAILNKDSNMLFVNSQITLKPSEESTSQEYTVSVKPADNKGDIISGKADGKGYVLDPNLLDEDREYEIGIEPVSDPDKDIFASRVVRVMVDTQAPTINAGYDVSNWHKEGQSVQVSVTDNLSLARVNVMEGGNCIYEWHAKDEAKTELSFSVNAETESEGSNGSRVIVWAIDKAGNENMAEYVYYMDKSSPCVEVTAPSSGAVCTTGESILIDAGDNNPAAATIGYELIRICDGIKEVTDKEIPIGDLTDRIKIDLSEEGEYEYKVYSFDCAGNCGNEVRGNFRVDLAAPVIDFQGVENGGYYENDVTLAIGIEEKFYEDTDVVIKGVRHTPDKDIDIPIDKFRSFSGSSSLRILIDKSGEYDFYVLATDKAGRRSEKSVSFEINKDKPELELTGLPENGATNKDVTITSWGKSFFYDKCAVTNKIYRKNVFGKYELTGTDAVRMKDVQDSCVSKIEGVGDYRIVSELTKDGKVMTSCQKDLTIDKTAPKIGYTSLLDRKYFKRIHIPSNLDNMVSDNGAVNFRKFLNSEEFEKDMDIEKEGKYVLYIEAHDEAGNYADASCEFIVDNTCPVVVIKGISPEKKVRKGDIIEISIENEEDFLERVTLDGNEVELSSDNMTCSITADDIASHLLGITATDKAGNEVYRQIRYSGEYTIDLSQKDEEGKETLSYSGFIASDSEDRNHMINLIGFFAVIAGCFGLSYRAKCPKNGRFKQGAN